MSTNSKNPYARIATKPLPRAELAPSESAPREEEGNPTLVMCTVCRGAGMLLPEVAAEIERILTAESDRR